MSETQDRTDGVTHLELLRMDAATAQERYRRGELSDDEFEQWARLNDLEDRAEETKRNWRENDETVIDAAIQADLGELERTGEWYGNEITFLLDLEELRDVFEELDDDMAEKVGTQGVEFADEDLERAKDALARVFAWLWIRFDGGGDPVEFDEYDDDALQRFARSVVDEWGVYAANLCLLEQISEIVEYQQEVSESLDSFRSAQGRPTGSDDGTQQLHDTRRIVRRDR